MGETVRLRQVVIAAAELEPVRDALRSELGLGEPFADPGVGAFGLRNAVFALGDRFIEVIAPARADTAVDRWLARHGGDGGYMLIFQLDDLEAARERARAAGVRVVWQLDLDDISGTHLHPADMRGAIVSLDRADPPESWRWGGPDWTGKAGTGAPGRVLGATVAVPDAQATAARWADILGAPAPGIRFEEAPADRGVTEFRVAVPADVRRGRDDVTIGGVRFRLEEE